MTKTQFVNKMKRKGRSKAQANALWKGIQASKRKRKRKTTTKRKPRSNPTSGARRARATTRRRRAGLPPGIKTKSKRRRTARAAPKRRTTKRRATRRRRSNPSFDLGGFALAVSGGALMAGADYGLDQVEQLSNLWQGVAEAAGGLVLGGALSFVSPSLGGGVAAGGAALGGKKLLTELVTYLTKEDQAAEAQLSGARAYAQLHAVEAPLGAVEAPLGAVEAPLGSTYATMR